jgi:hypothetical protein
MKKCSVCKIEKPLSEFGSLKSNKDGLRYDCKNCKKEKSRLDRLKNKKPKKEKYSYPYRTIFCMECGVEHSGNFSHTVRFCSEECSQQSIKRSNRQSSSKRTMNDEQKERKKEIGLKSYHKLKHSEKNKEYKKNYSQRLEVRLKNALRSRVKIALKKPAKKTRTHLLVGCSIDELKLHIEKQFRVGMTWENWEQFGWHLDHIIPLASAKTKEELERLCHYTNLQPLWWRDNLEKRDKIIENTNHTDL